MYCNEVQKHFDQESAPKLNKSKVSHNIKCFENALEEKLRWLKRVKWEVDTRLRPSAPWELLNVIRGNTVLPDT